MPSIGERLILKVLNQSTSLNDPRREQIDLSTPHPLPALGAPIYRNLLAPNQWPDPSFLPTFRPVFETYIRQVATLSTRFTSLIAEALHMPQTAFDRFFDADQQHKLKIVKYPDTAALPLNGDGNRALNRSSVSLSRSQGVGPHKDSMLTSYLLQASPHHGLQAQNMSGEWIDCPPLPSTLVVAIGQSLEAVTDGVCSSTTHRVLSPLPGSGPRFSVPFFQGVSIDASIDDAVLDVPAEILAMRDEFIKKRGGVRKDDVEFQFKKGGGKCHGEVTLWNRCKSHPDVAEAWYPEILAKVKEEAERKGLQLGSAY